VSVVFIIFPISFVIVYLYLFLFVLRTLTYRPNVKRFVLQFYGCIAFRSVRLQCFIVEVQVCSCSHVIPDDLLVLVQSVIVWINIVI